MNKIFLGAFILQYYLLSFPLPFSFQLSVNVPSSPRCPSHVRNQKIPVNESDPNESNQVLCKYRKQIDFYTMEAQFAMWPVFAKHLGNRMYPSEYFAIQCDAHVDFVLDWDSIRLLSNSGRVPIMK